MSMITPRQVRRIPIAKDKTDPSSRKRRRVFAYAGMVYILMTFVMFLIFNFQSEGSLIEIIASSIGCVGITILIFLVDKTKRERDHTEATLRENQARYLSIIAASNTGAWEHHSDTNYLWCSPEYFQMLGYKEEDFTTDKPLNMEDAWAKLLHPDDRPAAESHYWDYLSKGSPGFYEASFRMKHRDGSWVWIWSRGQTLRSKNDDPTNMTLGTHINITEKKILEIELLRHNQKLIKYAFMNAHEVRGPVARLLGLVEISKIDRSLDHSWLLEKVKQEAENIDAVLSKITAELNEIEERTPIANKGFPNIDTGMPNHSE